MKKNNHFKRNLIIGLSVCVVALSGVAFAYNQKDSPTTPGIKENPTTQKKGIPLNPIGSEEKEETLIPKKKANNASTETTDSFRPVQLDPQIASFRNNPNTQNLENERNEALALLTTTILNDQKKEESQSSEEKPQPQPVEPAPVTPIEPPIVMEPSEPEEPEVPIIPPVIEVDYTLLTNLVSQAQRIDLNEYVSNSTASFSAELLISLRLLETQDSSQQAIDNQVWRLQKAINELVRKGNKANLTAAYEEGMKIQLDIYTEESVAAFESSLARVKEVLENGDVSQETVDQAQRQLSEAISNLTEKDEPDLSLAYLNRIVSVAQSIQMDDYTSSTTERLAEVLQGALDYIELGEYTKEKNEQWQNELQTAIDGLEMRGDRTQLQELLEKADSIQREMYEESSLDILDAVVESIISQLENEDLLQHEIDSLESQLQGALDQLSLMQQV